MAISTLDEKFLHEIGDIYDAEHHFLEGQQKMLQNASNPLLHTMIQEHIAQTQQHIQNLDQVFSLLGQKPKRVPCDAAQGLASEAAKGMKESAANPAVRDTIIAGAADKVEHYEIASYRGLITGAELMGQSEIVTLLRRNLQQEEQTSQKIEQSMPQLLQAAMSGRQVGK